MYLAISLSSFLLNTFHFLILYYKQTLMWDERDMKCLANLKSRLYCQPQTWDRDSDNCFIYLIRIPPFGKGPFFYKSTWKAGTLWLLPSSSSQLWFTTTLYLNFRLPNNWEEQLFFQTVGDIIRVCLLICLIWGLNNLVVLHTAHGGSCIKRKSP